MSRCSKKAVTHACRRDTEIQLIEDKIGCLNKENDPFDSIGNLYFEKDTGLLKFVFFLSSDFFGRVSSSLQADKIRMFYAEGEPLKNDFAGVFRFDLRTD